MKKDSIVFGATILGALGIAFLLYGRRFRERPKESPPHEVSRQTQSLAQAKSAAESGRISRTAQEESEADYKARMRAEVEAAIAKNAYPEHARHYLERSKIDRLFDWKQSIEFYGKVVDENGGSIAGALINFAWNDLSEEGTSKCTALSDADGRFSLQAKQGKLLTVTVSKDGYYTPPVGALKGFEYANPFEPNFHRPDPSNPVIFPLRKKGEAEPMISGMKLFGSRIDGTPSYIDLVEGKNRTGPPGDLMLRVTRGGRDANRRFDWSVSLEVPDGGLIASTNDFMFLAPEEGYQQRFEFAQDASDANWSSQLKRKFYVKSRGGKTYSRIEVTFIPKYNEIAAVDIQYFLNPSGSRNLEYDPAVQNHHNRSKLNPID